MKFTCSKCGYVANEKDFEEDRDLHTELAMTIFHKKADDVTKEERSVAKTCNFLIGYGGGASTLKENLTDAGITITENEAQRILDTWHNMKRYKEYRLI